MGVEGVGKEGELVGYGWGGDMGNVIEVKLTRIGGGEMGGGRSG